METRTLGLGLGIMALVLFVFLGSQISYETAKYPDLAVAATTTSVTVTADVTTAISCVTNPASTAFGTSASAETINGLCPAPLAINRVRVSKIVRRRSA